MEQDIVSPAGPSEPDMELAKAIALAEGLPVGAAELTSLAETRAQMRAWSAQMADFLTSQPDLPPGLRLHATYNDERPHT